MELKVSKALEYAREQNLTPNPLHGVERAKLRFIPPLLVPLRIHYMELKVHYETPTFNLVAYTPNPLHGVESYLPSLPSLRPVLRIHYMELKGELQYSTHQFRS